jgi:hypothetical protein
MALLLGSIHIAKEEAGPGAGRLADEKNATRIQPPRSRDRAHVAHRCADILDGI